MWKRIAAGVGLLMLAGGVAFFALAPGHVERGMNPLTMPEGGWQITPEAQALHDGLIIGDWHSDALLWDRDLLTRVDRGHTDIPRLQDGNVALQVFTTVTKSPRGQNYAQNSAEAPDNITPLFIGQLRPVQAWTSLKARALVQARALRDASTRDPEALRVIRTRSDLTDLLAARQAGARTVGGILGSEGGHPLEGDIAALDEMYDAGFRLIGLTHFFDNELGGSLHGEGGTGAGLSDFGRQVVSGMVERQMIVDLAHASPQMVRDVLQIDGVRPVLSHTGIQGHCPGPRNLSDDLVRAIADKGGLIGIGFWSDVVCGPTPGDVAGAIKAAIRLVGEDHVSLGSDHDGSVDSPFGAANLAALTQALIDAGLTEAQIAKVMGGNMVGFLLDSLPEDDG
ncbi:membrane dipeptidase [Paracoccus sp. 1_MG-2023]|uniref:dipeptidase n=1 Tax=unclassified Paracoccus (in: a-proteobacteria) TaxID=2688777 RepID=UPI001C0832CC|nr:MULTISPECIES: membrane dipeptidase [unclassified Paracoccus (in: a-proteobacteria)]MBU2956680.1 membrane dipeptidase [Paracoccus sp. C2R09]MDO6668785.1 membrane dipeptidase [Paracoccus sp. 1_MG-2023]